MAKAGDVIKIEKEAHRKIADKFCEDQRVAKMAFVTASSMVEVAHERMWAYLHEICPDSIGRTSRYCSETHSIEIMGKVPE